MCAPYLVRFVFCECQYVESVRHKRLWNIKKNTTKKNQVQVFLGGEEEEFSCYYFKELKGRSCGFGAA